MKFKILSDEKRCLNLNTENINTYISRWKPKTRFIVEIKRYEKKVSDPMRKLYFGVVLPPFMAHLGYDPDEQELFHRQLKIVYFNIKPDAKGIYRKVPSVFGNESELPMSEKKKYLDWVLRKSAQEGCYIDIETGE